MSKPPPALTQGGLLARQAAEIGDHPAVVFPARGLRWSYAGLERRARELARGLIAAGVQPGEHVTLWSDNRPDWIALQFALARSGAVLVTANTALKKDEIRYVLTQSRSAALITAPGFLGEEYLDALAALLGEGALPRLRAILVLEGTPRPGMAALEDAVGRGRAVAERLLAERLAACRPDDPANIQYTSGTTGFPKGVVLSHRNLIDNAWTMGEILELSPADRVLLQVPLFHCFGCATTLLSALSHGAAVVALQRFDPLASLQALAQERCTVVNGVPTMFHAILNHPEFRRYKLDALRTGVMAGAPCPAPLMRRAITELPCPGLLSAYGLTEASPGVTMPRPVDPLETRCNTVGRPFPGQEVKIVDPRSLAELPPGRAGELWVRGANVMRGYFDQPAATAEVVTGDGWLRSGDLATMDESGLVCIVGRIKEMIIRGGENVYPAEVEDAIRRHPKVRDAAVFGLPSEEWGEEVAAAVIPAPGAALQAAELGEFLRDHLAYFKRPAHLFLVEAFPLTPSGKVQKFRLVERFAKQHA